MEPRVPAAQSGPATLTIVPYLSSQILSSVMVWTVDVFVTLIAYSNWPPGSGSELLVGSFTSFVAVSVPVSTMTGTWNLSSHTHFDFVSGVASLGLLSR